MWSLNKWHQPHLRNWQKHKFSDPTLDLPDQKLWRCSLLACISKALRCDFDEKSVWEASSQSIDCKFGVCVCGVYCVTHLKYLLLLKREMGKGRFFMMSSEQPYFKKSLSGLSLLTYSRRRRENQLQQAQWFSALTARWNHLVSSAQLLSVSDSLWPHGL